jgi:phage terminase large subunit-like protein
MATDLVEIQGNRLKLHFHKGQQQGWNSTARFILLLAGTQGGKTSFGPHWLMREMQQQGPGDYMVVTPTYPLLSKKALPEFRRVFEDWFSLGAYNKSEKIFVVSEEGQKRLWGQASDILTQVFFGYAADPDSLESATAKAAWLDEAGQKKFKLASWQAILRRLSLNMGRALIYGPGADHDNAILSRVAQVPILGQAEH